MANMACITKQGSQTPIIQAVKGDRNTRNFTFVVERCDGEVDLSELVWRIETVNAAGVSDGTALFTYRTDKEIQLVWPVGGLGTAEEGRTQLQVIGFDTQKNKQWSSGLYYMDVGRQIGIPCGNPGSGGGGSVVLDDTLTQPGMAADAKAVGDAVGKLTENKLANNLGAKYAGNLLYVDGNGYIVTLALGAGLAIENGVLNSIGGGGGNVDANEQAFYTADGSVFHTMDDAVFYVKGVI